MKYTPKQLNFLDFYLRPKKSEKEYNKLKNYCVRNNYLTGEKMKEIELLMENECDLNPLKLSKTYNLLFGLYKEAEDAKKI